MKKILLFGIVILCAATVSAHPHRGRHHGGNKGIRLATDIVNLVGASVNTVAAITCPRTTVVVHTPPPPRRTVVVHHAPPPPRRTVVVHHVPRRRPVVIHRHAPPHRHHGHGFRGGRR